MRYLWQYASTAREDMQTGPSELRAVPKGFRADETVAGAWEPFLVTRSLVHWKRLLVMENNGVSWGMDDV